MFVDVRVSVFECVLMCECVYAHKAAFEWHMHRYFCISFWIQCLARIAPEACVQRQGGDPRPVGSGWWRGLLRNRLGRSQLNLG